MHRYIAVFIRSNFRVGYITRFKEEDYVCLTIVPYYVAILQKLTDGTFMIVDRRESCLLQKLSDGSWTSIDDEFITGDMSSNSSEIIEWNISKVFPKNIQVLIDQIKVDMNGIGQKSNGEQKRDTQLSMELMINERKIKELENRNSDIKRILKQV